MSDRVDGNIDRLSMRTRPLRSPIMYQSWGKLLFMHWPAPAEALRPFIPERLTIDTFKDTAWLAVTPFTAWGVRPIFTPPVPGISAFHEINVRTYVHLDGAPGVWFFSLDASSRLAVWAARTFFHLPYHPAHIRLRQEGANVFYHARRKEHSATAEFDAAWTIGDMVGSAAPDTLEFFLVERYCLYTTDKGRLYRSRIFHQPWPLQKAELASSQSTMLASQGLPAPAGDPLLHYAESVDVEIWPLEEV